MIAVPCWSSWKTGICHPLAQPRLDLEAFRRLDVLEIDAAEGRLQRRDDVADVVDLVGVDLDVEDVDVGEFLEQDRLALHHRLGGEGPDIAEPEDGGAVGDDGDEVGAAGVDGRGRRIGLAIARQGAATPGE